MYITLYDYLESCETFEGLTQRYRSMVLQFCKYKAWAGGEA